MTYQEQEFNVSQSLHQQQGIFNNRNNRRSSSHLSSTQSLRAECKAKEQHFVGEAKPYYIIHSSLKPIHFEMNDQDEPIQFQSEITLNNDFDNDLCIRRLRIALRIRDSEDSSSNTQLKYSPNSSEEQQSVPVYPVDESKSILIGGDKNEKANNAKLSQSNILLHQWIDDICSNEQLMRSEDIVFFIKKGEFFVRI